RREGLSIQLPAVPPGQWARRPGFVPCAGQQQGGGQQGRSDRDHASREERNAVMAHALGCRTRGGRDLHEEFVGQQGGRRTTRGFQGGTQVAASEQGSGATNERSRPSPCSRTRRSRPCT